MQLSPAEFELLRTRPQTTKLYLSIFQPVAIFKAQVNNVSSAKGDRVITFDNTSLGLYTYIRDGMTMWVGTTPGGMELGKIRVRSATSTQITVSENSDIVWTDNAYLTVFRYWELWPVYPRIIQNPSNAEDVIFYKDYDILYTNQNSILGTYINAGPHRAALLDPASGQARIYYSTTGTYNILGSSLNYNWFFEGATVTGSSSAVPGYITYNTPGHYVTRLSISGSNGSVDTTYRYVSIYNNANPPIQKWELSSLQGSRDEGGYTTSLKVFEIVPIQEHAVVVIFGQNEYGNTQINLGGNFPNAGDILFVGYVDKDSISYDYQHSEVSFDATSLTAAMQKSSGFGVSVKSVLTPSKWYELLDMDGRRALYHYLRWHTTAMSIADFQFIGNDYPIQFFDSDRESMYDAINNYMQNTLVGKVVSDRQGKVWMEVDAMAYPDPTGTFTSKMNITKRDWMNQPVIEERLTNDVSYMEYGGVAYSGVNTGTFDALISEAPGNAPGFYGTMDSHQGLALQGQTQLNRMLGNIFANKNSPFPTIGLDMGINAANLDIAPQEASELHIPASETVRNVSIDGLYIPDSMSWKYNPKGLSLLPVVDYRELVNGDTGTTVTIPPVADVGGGYTSSGYGLNLPPLPNIFAPTVPSTGDGAPARVLVHDPTAGLVLTQTFNTPTPVWYQVNSGLTVAQYQGINEIVVCPNGAIYVARARVADGLAFIARADFAGGTFTVLQDQTSINGLLGVGGNAGYVGTIGCNPFVGESVVYALTDANTDNTKAYIGSDGTYTEGANFNLAPTSISFWNDTWLLTGTISSGGPKAYFRVLTGNIATATSSGFVGSFYTDSSHIRNATTGKSLHWVNGNSTITIGENNCSTLTDDIGADVIGNITGDPTLTYLMGWVGAGNSRRGKSSDGGYSWSLISTLPVLVNFIYCCVDASRWIAAASYIWYTSDFGISFWKDKQGNLNQINPLFQLDIVKVV